MLLVTRVRQLGLGLRYLRRMTRGRRAALAHLRAPAADNNGELRFFVSLCDTVHSV